MRTRLISLVILLVVGAGAVAGAPLHSNEQSCSVGDAMGEMDCCKAALMKAETAQSASARLCCAVNCSHDGSTPPSSVRVSPQSQPAVTDYQPGTPALPASVLLTLHISHSHGPPTDSHPAYIRHLALLI
ncbi:MAG TPA: hypothetical protein VHE60_16130 [Pyrinomonadaceae bacterium]|nr:hypothetical protein [Pyrinomonadaceae bacterium]